MKEFLSLPLDQFLEVWSWNNLVSGNIATYFYFHILCLWFCVGLIRLHCSHDHRGRPWSGGDCPPGRREREGGPGPGQDGHRYRGVWPQPWSYTGRDTGVLAPFIGSPGRHRMWAGAEGGLVHHVHPQPGRQRSWPHSLWFPC